METPGNRSGDEGIFKRLDPRELLALGLSGQAEPFNPEQLPADPRASFKPENPADVLGPVNLSQLPELSFREEPPSNRENSVTISDRTQKADPLPASAPAETPPAETYAFVLGRVIGRGGMAEVREARQVSLGRTVAVKRPTVAADTTQEQALVEKDLFAREAVVTARLEHPNVVPVHDLGQGPDGLPMLAMKLVQGTRWPDLLYADRHLGMRERLAKHLPILIDVGQAVAFAHERGIIHRDLKPGQVMVGRHGEVYLMDWGLAVSFERGDMFVESGSQVTALAPVASTNAPNPAGTPAYMAPEQTDRTGARLGPWTDIWLLGAILYDVLTGTPPYLHDRAVLAFAAAARGEVEPPEARVSSERAASGKIPLELSQLCMECLRAGIDRRVASTEIFVEKLKAYQTGATRREESRVLAAEATAVLGAAAADTKTAGLNYDDLEECDRKLSRALSLDSENTEAAAGKQRVIWELARVAFSGGDLKLARVQSGRLADEHQRADLLKQITVAETQAQRQRVQRVAAIVLSGLLIIAVAAVALFSRARIADALSQSEASATAARKAEADARAAQREADFSRALAVGQQKHAEQAATEARRQQKIAEEEQYYSAIGLAEATAREGRFTNLREILFRIPERLRNWEWGHVLALAESGFMTLSARHFVGDSPDPAECAVFSPNGRQIAIGHGDGSVRLYETNTGRQTLILRGHSGTLYNSHLVAVCDVAYSSDGNRLISVGSDGDVRVWDVETGTQTGSPFATSTGVPLPSGTTFPNGSNIKWVAPSVAISPDGRRVITGANNGQVVRIWDSDSRVLLLDLPTSIGTVIASFSPDGNKFLTALADGTIRVWNSESGVELSEIQDHPNGHANAARFSPNGHFIVTAWPDGTARTFDTLTGNAVLTLRAHSAETKNSAEVKDVSFSLDGTRIVTASVDGTVRTWDARTGQLVASVASESLSARFSPDGERIVTVSAKGRAKIWKSAETRDNIQFDDGGNSDRLATSQTDLLRVKSFEMDMRVETYETSALKNAHVAWNTTSGRTLVRYSGHECVVDSAGVRFSPDGVFEVRQSAGPTWKVNPQWKTDPENPDTVPDGHGGKNSVVSIGPSGVFSRTGVSAQPGALQGWYDVPFRLKAPGAGTVNLAFESHDWSETDTPMQRGADDVFETTVPMTEGEHLSYKFVLNGAESWRGSCIARNVRTGKILATLAAASADASNFSPDGKCFLSINANEVDVTARIWQTSNWECLHVLSDDSPGTLTKYPMATCFSGDGTHIAIVYWGGTVRIWDTASGKLLIRFDLNKFNSGSKFGIYGAEFSPDGSRLLVKVDGHIGIWDWSSARQLVYWLGTGRFEAESYGDAWFFSESFAPKGDRVVTVGFDNTVRIWDSLTGRNIKTLSDFKGRVVAAHFSSDGLRLLTATSEHEFRWWDALPWKTEEYPGRAEMDFTDRIELYKRQSRADAAIQPDLDPSLGDLMEHETVRSAGWEAVCELVDLSRSRRSSGDSTTDSLLISINRSIRDIYGCLRKNGGVKGGPTNAMWRDRPRWGSDRAIQADFGGICPESALAALDSFHLATAEGRPYVNCGRLNQLSDSLAENCQSLGDVVSTTALYKWAHAYNDLTCTNLAEPIAWEKAPFGNSAWETPPLQIILSGDDLSSSARELLREVDEHTSAPARAAAYGAAYAKLDQESLEYLDRVGPLPDLNALEARLLDLIHPSISLDTPLHQVISSSIRNRSKQSNLPSGQPPTSKPRPQGAVAASAVQESQHPLNFDVTAKGLMSVYPIQLTDSSQVVQNSHNWRGKDDPSLVCNIGFTSEAIVMKGELIHNHPFFQKMIHPANPNRSGITYGADGVEIALDDPTSAARHVQFALNFSSHGLTPKVDLIETYAEKQLGFINSATLSLISEQSPFDSFDPSRPVGFETAIPCTALAETEFFGSPLQLTVKLHVLNGDPSTYLMMQQTITVGRH